MSTPNDIEVLIHCCCVPGPHPRIDALAVRDALKQLVADGILKASGPCREDPLGDQQIYVATDKGLAWLGAICNVPYPEQRWIDEHGRIVGR